MKQKPRIIALGWLLTASVFVLQMGCGSDPKAKKAVAESTANGSGSGAGQSSAAKGSDRGDTSSATSGSVRVDDEIMKACGDIPKARFAFDSAAIQGDAATTLSAIARCFTKGALAGKGMRLVGHADPRGETEYNMALGHKRAGSVAGFLGGKGLARARVETTSRGELEASGVDEEGWANDRRVDIFIAK